MAFYDDEPFERLAAQRARADIIIERLAACVFGVCGAAAAYFDRWILAAGFSIAAVVLFCLSIFASKKFRRNYPGYAAARKLQAAPAPQSKPSLLAWFGILLIASGIIWAAIFFSHANRASWNHTPDTLLGLGCLVQALVGVIVITHTRRTPPV